MWPATIIETKLASSCAVSTVVPAGRLLSSQNNSHDFAQFSSIVSVQLQIPEGTLNESFNFKLRCLGSREDPWATSLKGTE